jgi:hypothetical protein
MISSDQPANGRSLADLALSLEQHSSESWKTAGRHTWAMNGPQSKTPTTGPALDYPKLLFLFENFGCEGRI